ncbi:hypothetical protein C8R46DRAFT_1226055 [Mycena filopes]|nr:hypothetical protein C8R46DRAFT_1226055 [Mycena filopes]
MFSDPAEIQRVKDLAAAPKKKVLKPVIKGYKLDALTVGKYCFTTYWFLNRLVVATTIASSSRTPPIPAVALSKD